MTKKILTLLLACKKVFQIIDDHLIYIVESEGEKQIIHVLTVIGHIAVQVTTDIVIDLSFDLNFPANSLEVIVVFRAGYMI